MREKSAPRNFLTEEFHEVSGRFVDMISWVCTPISMLAFRTPPCLQITTMFAVCPHNSSLPAFAQDSGPLFRKTVSSHLTENRNVFFYSLIPGRWLLTRVAERP